MANRFRRGQRGGVLPPPGDEDDPAVTAGAAGAHERAEGEEAPVEGEHIPYRLPRVYKRLLKVSWPSIELCKTDSLKLSLVC